MVATAAVSLAVAFLVAVGEQVRVRTAPSNESADAAPTSGELAVDEPWSGELADAMQRFHTARPEGSVSFEERMFGPYGSEPMVSRGRLHFQRLDHLLLRADIVRGRSARSIAADGETVTLFWRGENGPGHYTVTPVVGGFVPAEFEAIVAPDNLELVDDHRLGPSAGAHEACPLGSSRLTLSTRESPAPAMLLCVSGAAATSGQIARVTLARGAVWVQYDFHDYRFGPVDEELFRYVPPAGSIETVLPAGTDPATIGEVPGVVP